MSDDLQAGIFIALRDDAGVGAVVGNKISANKISEETSLPYIVYQIISEEGTHTQLEGGSLALTQVQFTIWATSALEAKSAKDAVRALFDGKIRQTFGSEFCQSVRNTNNTDTTEAPDDGSQNYAHGIFMDFDFTHER